MLDNGNMMRGILTHLADRHISWHEMPVKSVHADGDRWNVEGVVVDHVFNCSGHYTHLCPYTEDTRGWQSFYGELLRADHGFPLDEAIVMQWNGGNDVPSFAYVLPLEKDLIFVQETLLVTPHRADTCQLEALYRKRLQQLDLLEARVEGQEKGSFPMGGGVPKEESASFTSLGAAGRFVHQITGYQIGYSMRVLPHVVRGALRRNKRSPQADMHWLWSILRRFLTAMTPREQEDFFDSFLSMDREYVYPLLWRSASRPALITIFARFFAYSVWSTRAVITRKLPYHVWDFVRGSVKKTP